MDKGWLVDPQFHALVGMVGKLWSLELPRFGGTWGFTWGGLEGINGKSYARSSKVQPSFLGVAIT
jgi:hypothetical protein